MVKDQRPDGGTRGGGHAEKLPRGNARLPTPTAADIAAEEALDHREHLRDLVGNSIEWQRWDEDRIKRHQPAGPVVLHLVKQNPASLIVWFNKVGKTLLDKYLKTPLRDRAARARGSHADLRKSLSAHIDNYLAALVPVLGDLAVGEGLEGRRRLDLAPGVDVDALLCAADHIKKAATILRQSGVTTSADVLDAVWRKVVFQSGASYYLMAWHAQRIREERRPVGARRKSRRTVRLPTWRDADLDLHGGRIYQVLTTGVALPLPLPHAEDMTEVSPEFRSLTKCAHCELALGIEHDLLSPADIAPLLAEVLTIIGVKPGRIAAQPGDKWSTRAAQALIDNFKKKYLPRRIRVQ